MKYVTSIITTILLLLIVGSLLSSCGQSGPLYLPQKNQNQTVQPR